MINKLIFPKNLSKIQNMSEFRNYCLKPKGYEVKKTSNFEKPIVIENYLNTKLEIHRGENPLSKN